MRPTYSPLSSEHHNGHTTQEEDEDEYHDQVGGSALPTATSSYFSYPVRYAVGSVLRRLSADANIPKHPPSHHPSSENLNTFSKPGSFSRQNSNSNHSNNYNSTLSSYTPTPPRYATPPFQPPPLSPLALTGYKPGTPSSACILSKLLAEEIRLLVPTRLELVDEWTLVFSLEQNGSSLSTLYEKCSDYRGKRGGFVLVVKDGSGNIFGAYLNEAPRPSHGHYYGTGECFLWRSSILSYNPTLASLPPPPSADTTNLQRMTTLGSSGRRYGGGLGSGSASGRNTPGASGRSTPERIRFKAFPYSGVNDYMIFCEHGFLSVGGGDGHYGLWLDGSLENGISSSCPTFGNEPLSDEGTKFDVIGVEVWYIGA